MVLRVHKIGVTGTREGLTEQQKYVAGLLLRENVRFLDVRPEFHFGDCVGADSDLFDIASRFFYRTVSHPPAISRYRAYRAAHEICSPEAYLVRNRHIVDETGILLAFPKEAIEGKFGGTWYTVRYAREIGRPLIIVWPEGSFDRS